LWIEKGAASILYCKNYEYYFSLAGAFKQYMPVLLRQIQEPHLVAHILRKRVICYMVAGHDAQRTRI
jgi:hypothetical protein